MDANKPEIHYSNDEITVVWKPWLCMHSGHCWQELPEVFDPMERPWIRPENSDSDTIIQQVARCPSGALSIRLKQGEESD